jgi:hypothetical protein
MTMMLEIPDALKGMVPTLKALVDEAQAQVESGRTGGPVDYEAFERRLREKVAAVERSAHEAALSSLDIDAPKVLINGVLHARVGRHETTYMTQAGGVVLLRTLYRQAGQRNARALDPISLKVGMIEDVWLPGAARAMAHLLQQGTSREAEATAVQLGRLPYSRSSFERVGHAVGKRYVGQHQAVEHALIEAFEVPPEALSISVSLDRVSVPMEEPRPRPVGRPRKDAPKRPVSRVYRMAYCGTVTLHDAEGEALHTIRYGTMPNGDPKALCTGMADDVLALRAHRPEMHVSLLCDGAVEMWNLLDAEFDAATFGPASVVVHRRIDFWHVIEKLGAAARVIFGEGDASKNVTRWKLSLLNRSGAPADILAELVASGKEQSDTRDADCPVHDAITYLTNNADRMDYASARKLGLPIGSGNVEATCKSLVTLRMKRAGARWKTDTGEHIIHLRALALSDRWDDAMDIALRAPRMTIRRAAA